VIVREFVAIGGGVPPVKVAVTDCTVVPIVTVHRFPAVLVQPDQNTLPPPFAVAVNVTVVFGVSDAVQVCPPSHPMPPPVT
jgi:hypothetical protein